MNISPKAKNPLQFIILLTSLNNEPILHKELMNELESVSLCLCVCVPVIAYHVLFLFLSLMISCANRVCLSLLCLQLPQQHYRRYDHPAPSSRPRCKADNVEARPLFAASRSVSVAPKSSSWTTKQIISSVLIALGS